jgi:hypothetical protein
MEQPKFAVSYQERVRKKKQERKLYALSLRHAAQFADVIEVYCPLCF